MYISFQNPSYLTLLFIIPILIFFHFYNLKNLRGKAVRFANFEAIARVRGIDIYSKNIITLIINVLIIVSLVFSLSGFTLHMEMEASSFSYAIAIDSSESMGARDLKPDRLTAAKESAKEFIDSLPTGTMVGVISFASNTIIEKKLSDNKDSLKFSIDNIKLTNIGGTDIFEAYRTSSIILNKEPNKALIILSDGQINIGKIDEVVTEALRDEVIIHTIGIGTVSGGNASFGISKLDEDSLKSLAYSTNGMYFNVADEYKMKDSFKEIIPLTSKIAAINLSFYMIVLTIILFIILQIFSGMSKVSI